MKNILFSALLILFLATSCSKSNLPEPQSGIPEGVTLEEFESFLNSNISALHADEELLLRKEQGRYTLEREMTKTHAEMMGKVEGACCEAAGNEAFAAHIKDMLDKGTCVEIALNRWGSAVAAGRDCH